MPDKNDHLGSREKFWGTSQVETGRHYQEAGQAWSLLAQDEDALVGILLIGSHVLHAAFKLSHRLMHLHPNIPVNNDSCMSLCELA